MWVYHQVLETGAYQARPQLDKTSLIGDPSYCAQRIAYDWLCAQMQARGLPRPPAAEGPEVYPIWAYYQWVGPACRRPDLRSSALKSWAAQERRVLLTLRVPREQMLLSDYDAWHFPLNYSYLAGPRVYDRFYRELKARGQQQRFCTVPLPGPSDHEAVLDSWQAIFDLARSRKLLGIKKAHQSIQATFWELRAEQVVEARAFGAGERAVRLARPQVCNRGCRLSQP